MGGGDRCLDIKNFIIQDGFHFLSVKDFQVSFNNSILAGGIMMNFGGEVERRVGTEDWALSCR